MSDKVEIENERLFRVDAQTLFNAFAKPRQLERWWGPHGFTNLIHTFDLRPGGAWRITMTASNGTDFDNHSTFEIVEAPSRIAFLHHGPIHEYRMDMTFTPEDGGTRLKWLMRFTPNEDNITLKKFIAAANEQNFDRLEAFLEEMAGFTS